MCIKKYFTVFCAAILVVFVYFQNVSAYDPNWKETQQKVFSQIDVKPGDVINANNCKKIEGLVPDCILNWVKKGEWTITIGELNYDFSPDKQYLDDSKKNAGKYKIVAKGESKYMVESATGSIPKYVYGHPFPDVDVKNDPDGVIKFMYNAEAEMSRAGSQWNYSAAMEYWKTILVGLCRNDWENRQTFVAVNYTVGVDDRTHHASNVHSNGSHMNEPECRTRFMAPQVNRAMFTPAKLKIWSK